MRDVRITFDIYLTPLRLHIFDFTIRMISAPVGSYMVFLGYFTNRFWGFFFFLLFMT